MIKEDKGSRDIMNESPLALDSIPLLSLDEFFGIVVGATGAGGRIASLFGARTRDIGGIQLFAILAYDRENRVSVARTSVDGDSYPSLTPLCPQAHAFEREIAEQFGLKPLGHPWMKRLRYHASWTGRDAWDGKAGEPIPPAVGDFYRVEGEEVHEVAVGPVHAGIIEPGHFRFQCHGEEVFHLEIALGFQHRGIEEAMIGGPTKRSRHYVETAAGDTSVGHATAYAQACEILAGCRESARTQVIRGIALELERLANHVGDLGALSGDIGFQPTAGFCGRIRGDFLNMTALVCGNRFGRGLVEPSGVGYDLDGERAGELSRRLEAAERDTAMAVKLLWDNQSVMARFEDTGLLPQDVATELGIVGPAARASGLARDLRFDQPSGIFRFAQVPVSTCESGDVFARAFVRWLEIQQSAVFVREMLGAIPSGELSSPLGALAPDSLAVSLVEGWRGEICHAAITDGNGRFARYKIVDPSFHNWPALAYAMRGQDISDFPLCNKSFNLSYCGHDL